MVSLGGLFDNLSLKITSTLLACSLVRIAYFPRYVKFVLIGSQSTLFVA
jgi:hypothetical protein